MSPCVNEETAGSHDESLQGLDAVNTCIMYHGLRTRVLNDGLMIRLYIRMCFFGVCMVHTWHHDSGQQLQPSSVVH